MTDTSAFDQAGTPPTPTPKRVVDTDVSVYVYGLEDAEGQLPLPTLRIEDAINGCAVMLEGHKFVLCLTREREPERFWWPDEIAGKSLMIDAYIDGRTLMTLTRWAQVVVDEFGQLDGLDAKDRQEIEAAIANVRMVMEGVDFEVRGGG